MKIIATLSILLIVALTDAQFDRIFSAFDRLLDHSTKWLTLFTTLIGLFLAYRQHRNKKDTDKKINENTSMNAQALEVANGRSDKVTALTEEVAKVVAPDSPVVHQILSTGEVPNPTPLAPKVTAYLNAPTSTGPDGGLK